MSINFFNTIKQAFSRLNPDEIRAEAERAVHIGLFAQSETGYQQMEAYFTPAAVSEGRRAQVSNFIQRASSLSGPVRPKFDIEIYGQDMAVPPHGFAFYLENPERTVKEILSACPELGVTLARHVYPFREPFSAAIVKQVSKENALFSLATAIPDIIPFLTLPWAVGEFASDTVVLTANQVRLAFLLAAASDREVGYREQKGEIASIVLSAFGWRALAREAVGKIPFGGGLIPKAAVAYAGTRVAGMSLERYYRVGYGYTRQERKVAYEDALARGKTIAGSMLNGLKHREIPH